MKLFVFLSISFMLMGCNQNSQVSKTQELKTDLALLNLKGKVKKLTRYAYFFSEGPDSLSSSTLVDTYIPIEVIEFNPHGFITSIKYYKAEGEQPVSEHQYTYDSQHHLLSTQNTGTDVDGKPALYQTIYTYNDKGLRTSKIYSCNGKPLSKETYTIVFTPKGKEITINSHSIPDDKIFAKVIEYYNDKGLIISSKHFLNDTLSYLNYYTYNNKGQCISSEIRGAKGEVDDRTFYTYDNRGNPTLLKKEERGQNYQITTSYQYDTQGNITRAVSAGDIEGGNEDFYEYKLEYYN